MEVDLKTIFKTIIFQDRIEILEELFIEIMNYERLGNEIDTEILKNFFDFLNQTENFGLEEKLIVKIKNKILSFLCGSYSNNSLLKFNSTNNNFVDYLNWGKFSIEYEQGTLSKYLPNDIKEHLIFEIRKIIFYDRFNELMQSPQGIKYLLENYQTEVKLYFNKNFFFLILVFNFFIEFTTNLRNLQREQGVFAFYYRHFQKILKIIF